MFGLETSRCCSGPTLAQPLASKDIKPHVARPRRNFMASCSPDWCVSGKNDLARTGSISSYCRAQELHAVELVALRRVAPRRAAQRTCGAAHSVRSTRTGLSQRDKHHLQRIEMRPGGLQSVKKSSQRGVQRCSIVSMTSRVL